MSRGLQMLIGFVAVVAILSVSAFLYLTREIAAPSTDIAASVQPVATAANTDEVIFSITQEGTTAEYNIYELLNGSDKTVVGTTDQVAGEIALDLTDLSRSQIGQLRINARTFATDNDRRDNAVARFILQSENDANEFILFQPIMISGLSGSAGMGDSVQFQVTGDLTIAGVRQSVTFDVTASLGSAEQLTGHAEAVISRGDFNLNIPSVPFVANVGDEVTLKLDFVASAG